MQLTPYLTVFPHPDSPGESVLFAARTGALVVLRDEILKAIRGAGRPPTELIADLTAMGFLVPSREAEEKAVCGYLDEINRINPSLTLAVVLGLECNFACRYCFEGAQKGGGRAMDDRTADQLVAFIDQRFTPAKKQLKLEIYGGEPLLYRPRLLGLARRLKPLVEERGGRLIIDLVSNGSLLSEEVVAELTPWGLDGVKVTLDGMPENHNRFRPFKSGAASFDCIVANLARVCDKTKIRLGGNYTPDNYRAFPPLLDLLAARGVTPDKVEVVNFNIVMRVNDRLTANEYTGGCATVNEPWLREAALYIREEVLRRGYPVAAPEPAPCGVEVEDTFTVNFDGSLYKCVTWIGHQQYKIGDLRQGVTEDYRHSHHLLHWQREPRCRQCPYLPLCFGGCRYMAFQRDGHMATVDCKKPFFDATLPEMLRQELRYRYS